MFVLDGELEIYDLVQKIRNPSRMINEEKRGLTPEGISVMFGN